MPHRAGTPRTAAPRPPALAHRDGRLSKCCLMPSPKPGASTSSGGLRERRLARKASAHCNLLALRRWAGGTPPAGGVSRLPLPLMAPRRPWEEAECGERSVATSADIYALRGTILRGEACGNRGGPGARGRWGTMAATLAAGRGKTGCLPITGESSPALRLWAPGLERRQTAQRARGEGGVRGAQKPRLHRPPPLLAARLGCPPGPRGVGLAGARGDGASGRRTRTHRGTGRPVVATRVRAAPAHTCACVCVCVCGGGGGRCKHRLDCCVPHALDDPGCGRGTARHVLRAARAPSPGREQLAQLPAPHYAPGAAAAAAAAPVSRTHGAAAWRTPADHPPPALSASVSQRVCLTL